MAQKAQVLKKADAIVYCISNEKATDLQETRRDLGTEHGFIFLSDVDGKVASQYAGLLQLPANSDEPSMTLKPAVFVIGKDARIVYSFTDDSPTVRAKLGKVLSAVRKAAAELFPSHGARRVGPG